MSRTPLRNYAIATAAHVLGMTAHTTYMYYLAPIALRAAGIEGRDSVIFAAIAIAMGAIVVPAGRLADRIPRRYVMRLGLFLLSLAYLPLLLPITFAGVLAGTLSTGFGLAFLFVSFQSYVADLLRHEERGAAYGRAGALSVLASALGPFLAALVFRALSDEMLGLRVNGVLFGLSGVLGIALTTTLPSVRAVRPPPQERGRWHEAARAAGPVALVYVLMGAGYGMTAPYFTVYFLDHLRWENDAWGYLLAAGTLASSLGSFAAGEASRRVSPISVSVLGQALLLASSTLFLLPFAALYAVAFLGRSAFAATTAPSMNALLMQRARPARRAEASGYTSLAWNAGWATGAALGGAVLAARGGALFPIGGALALAGVAGGAILLRRR